MAGILTAVGLGCQKVFPSCFRPLEAGATRGMTMELDWIPLEFGKVDMYAYLLFGSSAFTVINGPKRPASLSAAAAAPGLSLRTRGARDKRGEQLLAGARPRAIGLVPALRWPEASRTATPLWHADNAAGRALCPHRPVPPLPADAGKGLLAPRRALLPAIWPCAGA